VLVLGAIGVAAAYFYTGAPLKLAYRGLGDLMVFAFMGPGYILGAYYVQTLSFTWTAAIASLPMGLLCSSLLQANNLRDIESDARSGKRTMAVMLGRQNARIELILSDMAAYAAVLIGVALRLLPWPALAVLVTLPRAIDQVRLVSGDANAEMHNRAMTRSGQLQFEFGLLLVAAFIVSYLFGL
jgi:1,4-dihydroxy-2-naphthoate octaprenyltransferase